MQEALAADIYGISYCAFTNVGLTAKVLAIAPRAGRPAVPLTIENVQNRTYPLHREQYVCINRAPGKPIDPALKEFIKYILSRQGQTNFVEAGKLLPLTPGVLEEQRKSLE